MITHYEATITLLGVIVGMLSTLIMVVWRARGWVDRLNTTDGQLAKAIEDLTRNQRELHQENKKRFEEIEHRLSLAQRRAR
jgi:predicted PurR-regulated permease PerM